MVNKGGVKGMSESMKKDVDEKGLGIFCFGIWKERLQKEVFVWGFKTKDFK